MPKQGWLRWKEVEEALRSIGAGLHQDPTKWPFAQVRLKREGLPVGFRLELDEMAERLGVRLVEYKLEDADEVTRVRDEGTISNRVVDLEPEEFFEKAFEIEHRRKPGEAHRAVFEQVKREVVG